MRTFCLKKDGQKSLDESAFSFMVECNYSCQCMLTTDKPIICRTCWQIFKIKSIWDDPTSLLEQVYLGCTH